MVVYIKYVILQAILHYCFCGLGVCIVDCVYIITVN